MRRRQKVSHRLEEKRERKEMAKKNQVEEGEEWDEISISDFEE